MDEKPDGKRFLCKMSKKEAAEFVNGKTIESKNVSILVEGD